MHSHSFWYDSRIRTTSGSGIICILHFWWIFYGSGPEDPDLGSRHTQQLQKNFKHEFFERKLDPRLPLDGSGHVFYNLAFKKDAVPGLRIETRIRDRSPDPRVRPCTGTVLRCGTAQQRTMDPASASGSAFRTVRYASAFWSCLPSQFLIEFFVLQKSTVTSLEAPPLYNLLIPPSLFSVLPVTTEQRDLERRLGTEGCFPLWTE